MGPVDPTRELSGAIRGVLEPTGLCLCDLEFATGPGGGRLRLVVDRPGGVTLDECSRASRLVSAWLDAADPLPGPYTLEVSSPGAERPLTDEAQLVGAIGHRVRLELEGGPLPARLVVEGWLVAVAPDVLELEVRPGRRRAGARRRVDRTVVVAARRLVDL